MRAVGILVIYDGEDVNITATSLPSSYPGTASYTLTQNTSHTAGNVVKHLPLNTSISSSSTCVASLNTPFTLNQGSSCTLDLSVTGPVSRKDANPNNHLMVCLSDGVTCTGTDPTNSIDVTPSTTEKYVFASGSEYGYVGLYSCPVGSSGIVPGVSACQKASISIDGSDLLVGAAYDATNNIVYPTRQKTPPFMAVM